MRPILAILILTCFFGGCDRGDTEYVQLEIPRGFPEPSIPEDNRPTKQRIELGKKLFFDPVLSRDSTVSCASCHFPEKKFTDGKPVSEGIENRQTLRNSISLINVAYQPVMFWDGGVPNLEQQVLAPIENPVEMDFDVLSVVERLKRNPDYVLEFQEAYDQEPSVFSLTRAIACFERTLFSKQSRYDDYLYDHNDTVLTESEKRGMDIFFGERGECFHCHNEYNFTNYSYQNNGIYSFYSDSGRARITLKASDVGKFKVPSLRNINKTAPYMHDGSLETLEAVIDHYNQGGKNHQNQSGLIKALQLTNEEKNDLVNFLKALDDVE
ncbi:cytochrome-c peroxidase [bacterium]|nr:cytochrome-c peroxidase [bacterium]